MHQCQTFTMKHGSVKCEHFDECHRLGRCLCEVDPEDPPVKRKRAAKLPWPERRKQILQLAAEQNTITTATLMRDTNAQHGTATCWLNKLVKEGKLKCQTPARPGRYNHRPAVYQIAPNNSASSSKPKPPAA